MTHSLKTALLLAACALLLLPSLGCQEDYRRIMAELHPEGLPEQRVYWDKVEPFVVLNREYQGPATRMLIKALPLNPTVREAVVVRHIKAFQLKGESAENVRQASAQEASDYLQVMLSLYVPDKKWNDLARSSPDWRVFLVNARGERQTPRDIRRIKNRSSLNEALYPFWGPWSRLYKISFSHTLPNGQPFMKHGDETVRFLITGPSGRSDLKLSWK